MRTGLIGGVVAATLAAAGGAVVAGRRVQTQRRPGIEAQDRFVAPEPRQAGTVRAADGVLLYYQLDGPDDAPVTAVLVHGFCQDRDDLLLQRRALLERFGSDIRIVSFDQRSHGRSTRAESDHATIGWLGRDLRAIVDQLAPRGSLVLVGHSMGGMSVLSFAEHDPELIRDRVAGVVLMSTSAGALAWLTLGLPAGLARIGDPVMRLALGRVRRGSALIERGRARVTDLSWVFTRRLGFGPDADPALVEFLSRMIGATPVDVIADFFPSLAVNDTRAGLEHLIGVPTVIVCGEDDLITAPAHSREMAARLPGAELVLVPGAGHQVLMERPDVVNPFVVRLVEDALNKAGQPV